MPTVITYEDWRRHLSGPGATFTLGNFGPYEYGYDHWQHVYRRGRGEPWRYYCGWAAFCQTAAGAYLVREA